MIMQKKNLLPVLRDYLVITVASFIFAMAWECFMIPNGMAAGGMMGLCTIIQYATGGLIEAQYSYIVINALLIITAVLAMGIGFGFKTIYCIIVSTLAMGLLDSATFLHSVEGNFFYVQERVLIPIIAGVLEAVGIGLVLRCGGSTGGTDIVALMVNKYWPLSLSTVFFFTDLAICSSTSAVRSALIFSLTLSNMTMVLLSEYPMIVSTAATVVAETSRRNMRMNDSIASTSWHSAMMADIA